MVRRQPQFDRQLFSSPLACGVVAFEENVDVFAVNAAAPVVNDALAVAGNTHDGAEGDGAVRGDGAGPGAASAGGDADRFPLALS